MKTIEELRAEKLNKLLDKSGSVADLAKKLDKSYAQVWQWINRWPRSKTGKPSAISSESARYIEAKFNKPSGWMDN